MRFAIRIDPVWRAFLLAGGATRRNSFVELTDTEITFRLGALFRRTFPRADIEGAAGRRWPIWYGVGWRSNLRGVIGLIGSYGGVVEVRLQSRSRAWGVFPCDRIAVSLEDPERFIEALSERLGTPVPADVSALAKPRRSPQRAATKRSAGGGQQAADTAAPRAATRKRTAARARRSRPS